MPAELLGIVLQLLSELLFDLRRQSEVLALGKEGTNLVTDGLQLFAERVTALGYGFATQQSSKQAVFFGDVMANRKTRALFAADDDLVLHDQFPDVFESYGRFMQRNVVVLGQSVDQVRSSHRFCNAILPAAAFDQVVEQH